MDLSTGEAIKIIVLITAYAVAVLLFWSGAMWLIETLDQKSGTRLMALIELIIMIITIGVFLISLVLLFEIWIPGLLA